MISALRLAVFLIAFVLLSPGRAGACTGPAGSEGDMLYNVDFHVFQYCDGSNWIAAGPEGGGGGGGPADYTDNLVGWWKLDEASGTFADSSPSNHPGTDTGGVTYAQTGQIDDAVDFGNSAYINIGDFSELDFDRTDSFTLAAWVYRTSGGSYDGIISKAGGGCGPGYYMKVDYTGDTIDKAVVFELRNGAEQLAVRTPSVIENNQWYHVVATYDGSTTPGGIKIYINGVPASLTTVRNTLSTASISTTAPAMIGATCNGAASYKFSGKIDDARIYNTELTAAQVQQIFQAGNPDITTGLVGHWKLDETTGANIVDATGNHDGTWDDNANNSVAEETVSGMVGTALHFDGTDDVIDLGDNYDLAGQSFTVCAWAKPINSTVGYIFGKFTTGTNTGFWLRADSGGSNWSTGTVSGTSITVNEADSGVWQHLCSVINPSPATSLLYEDGLVIGSSTSIAATADNSVAATIGNRYDNARQFEGNLDEVRVYDRALSPAEVAALYLYDDTGSGGGSCSSPAGVEGEMIYNNGSNVMQYCNGSEWIQMGAAGGAVAPTSGLVGHWKLDETSGTFADSSPSNNPGTDTGGVTYAQTGVIGNAVDFGNASYIDVGNVSELSFERTDPFSLSAWIWRVDNSGNYDGIISKEGGSCGPGYMMKVDVASDTNDRGLAFMLHNGSQGILVGTATGTIQDQQWYHVVATYDGSSDVSGVNLYVNGAPISYNTWSNDLTSASILTSSAARIGGMCGGASSYRFNGLIDDARIYDRELTSTEVQQLYQATAGGGGGGDGYLVRISSPVDGDLQTAGSGSDGIDGANKLCLSDLQANDWMGKSNVILSAGAVTAFLCDGSTCNNLEADTDYALAQSGNAGGGGHTFTTDGSGLGPNDSKNWSAADAFGDVHIWTDRAAGSSTKWAATNDGSNCSDWASTSGSGTRGHTNSTSDSRWADDSAGCGTTQYLLCVVSPSANAPCSGPAGVEGQMIYNDTYNVLQYCNGTEWVGVGK